MIATGLSGLRSGFAEHFGGTADIDAGDLRGFLLPDLALDGSISSPMSGY
jgi:hypothetical protein